MYVYIYIYIYIYVLYTYLYIYVSISTAPVYLLRSCCGQHRALSILIKSQQIQAFCKSSSEGFHTDMAPLSCPFSHVLSHTHAHAPTLVLSRTQSLSCCQSFCPLSHTLATFSLSIFLAFVAHILSLAVIYSAHNSHALSLVHPYSPSLPSSPAPVSCSPLLTRALYFS